MPKIIFEQIDLENLIKEKYPDCKIEWNKTNAAVATVTIKDFPFLNQIKKSNALQNSAQSNIENPQITEKIKELEEKKNRELSIEERKAMKIMGEGKDEKKRILTGIF